VELLEDEEVELDWHTHERREEEPERIVGEETIIQSDLFTEIFLQGDRRLM
jgi:hypothetical protein